MPKKSGYVKTFKVKDGDKDKNDKPFLYMIRTYQKNIKLFGLKTLQKVNDDRYTKTKIRTYGDKVYANFFDLNVPEYKIQCESFTVISIHSLLVYENKYYLQVYLDNFTDKTPNKQITHYFDDNLFDTD